MINNNNTEKVIEYEKLKKLLD